jgi:cytochrome P450
LTPERLGRVEPFIRRRAGELRAGFAGDGHAELMGTYANRLPVDVACELFGLTGPEDAAVVAAGTYALSMLNSAQLSEDQQVASISAVVELQRRPHAWPPTGTPAPATT